tara:strand:+ start:55 stop:348 length:294 start_codon:yes stop_codon:yes gene_type:complete
MSVQAYSVESFEEFRKTFKKTLELYNPPRYFLMTLAPYIQKWADVGERDPPYIHMYRDFASAHNYAILNSRTSTFFRGNIYMVFDDSIIERHGILSS